MSEIKVKNSEAHIEGEIPWEGLDRHRTQVLEELRRDFAAPGFRKGHVPMDIFLQHVRGEHVLEDAAERALQEAYPSIVEEHGLDVLGRPEVTITKMAMGNPLGYRIKVGVVPEVVLPDYKKIAKKIISEEAPEVVLDPQEMEKVIDELRGLRRPQDGTADAPLPELTDEFVKTLGNFADVQDFRTKLAANMKLEKENEKRQERREKIAAALLDKTKIVPPQSILDAEEEAMQARLEADLERAKISLEDYLGKVKKTIDDLRKEHRSYAERQLQTRFVLEAIAKAENLTADPEELAANIQYLKTQHSQSDPEALSRYAETLLRNEKVLKFLESSEN